MRLHHLDLIRYGKFTDQALHFPASACDFHLIVGANEAGKSTLRRAVIELLYGMPLRSDMDFVHPLPDLRLGAVIQSAAGELAFQRRRGRKPLCTPDDETLPETVLTEHLGGASASVFERMFCLDLNGLIQGGQSLLDASDDAGQLLFQSATGLGHLRPLCETLENEADLLYAPRKAGKRTFYQALDRYDDARHTLKTRTVNTRQWRERLDALEAADAALVSADADYQRLTTTRLRLERIRRIGPVLAKWQAAQEEALRLASVTWLPEDAARQLSEAELTQATQSAGLKLHQERRESLSAQRAALHPDAALLAASAAVDALARSAQTLANHRRDLQRRQEEVAQQLREVATLATQLGWPTQEAALRERLPSALALKAVEALLRERGACLQAWQSAQEAQQRAALALARLQQRGQAQAVPAPSAELLAALEEAQTLRQIQAGQHSLRTTLQQTHTQLTQALAALAPWQHAPATLATLRLPSEERLSTLKQEHATLAARTEAARKQHGLAREQARRSALAVAQFSAGRQLVTLTDVLNARQQRDVLWQQIKTHALPLDSGAAPLDAALQTADQRADALRDGATDAAQLLTLHQQNERDATAEHARAAELAEAETAQTEFDTRWDALCTQAGVPGLALADASGWLALRRSALELFQQHEQHSLTLATQNTQIQAAQRWLSEALHAHGAPVREGATLADVCKLAEQRVSEFQAARAASEQLAQQIHDAQAELAHQNAHLKRQTDAWQQWQARWRVALVNTNLQDAVAQDEAAGAALELAGRITQALAEVDDKRLQRIEAMRADLAHFAQQVQEVLAGLAAQVDSESPAGPAVPAAHLSGAPAPGAASGAGTLADDPFVLTQTLAQRLQTAREQQREWQRLSAELAECESAERRAEAALAATRATLGSLHAAAGTEDSAELRRLIDASDRRRRCDAELHQLRQELLAAGDGLTLDALHAECASVPPEQVLAQLEGVNQQLGEIVTRKTTLAAERSQAHAALAAIQGGADAAVAEAQRQEALAQMGEAAQRYVKVSSAARLLRWAIERYRERQQGPLLQRAGQLFCQLTLGGFERLVTDLDSTPPRLLALRNTGKSVPIEGLSEGTRDQLFLALRLAALELHLASATPLPFIADDLFVNFHDARSRAGLAALGELAQRTQVIFLTHHTHLVEVARQSVGAGINVVELV